jgi:hypothetical protein
LYRFGYSDVRDVHQVFFKVTVEDFDARAFQIGAARFAGSPFVRWKPLACIPWGVLSARYAIVELAMTDEEMERLAALSRLRTEPASRVSRAQMLLAYRENPSFCAVGQRVGVHHQTVQRCVERALTEAPRIRPVLRRRSLADI